MGDDRVSRMAAVLVLAAGGKIRVPLSMIEQARFIRLHQIDSEPGYVTYTATPHDRAAAGTIIEGKAEIVEQPRQVTHNKGTTR